MSEALSHPDLLAILYGIAAGTIARAVTVRIDSRQVPSYPNGYFINLVTGFIASALGAVAVPALLARDFAAVTFLALAVQHFRDVRKQEQESLEALERAGFSERGSAYIDGIAKTYEARNYISMLTALATVLALKLLGAQTPLAGAVIAAAAGLSAFYLMVSFTKGKRAGDICDISEGEVSLEGAELYVDGIYVTNALGTERAQELFRAEGFAAVVRPRAEKHRLAIEHSGQRQAMLFEAIRSFGVKQYQFTQRSLPDGRVVVAFVPILPDHGGILAAIRATPILESGRKRRTARG